jgi:hypothetical protein
MSWGSFKMVDWKQLSDEWNKISVELRNKIIASMRQKQIDNPQKFDEWLKQDSGRQTIWNNYAAPAVAAKKVMEAARPTPAAVPTFGKGLTESETSLLHDEFNNVLFRNLGRVPSNSSSTFRVELAKVKNKSYQEALEHILNTAQDIADEFKARETLKKAIPIRPSMPKEITRIPEVRRPPPEIREGGEEEAGQPVVGGRAPPAQFPSFTLDYNLPFPRGPTSRERIRIWMAFRYQMQQQGYDPDEYERQFEDYIAKTQFLSWDDLRKRYDEFVKDIVVGVQLPPLFLWRGVPIPTGLKGTIQEGTELERLNDLLVHYMSTTIRNARSRGDIATTQDLKDELVERGIIPADTPLGELRTNARNAWNIALQRKDLWTSGISSTEINDLLAET